MENIYSSIWNDSYIGASDNAIMVHIKNLRKKSRKILKSLNILRQLGEGDIILVKHKKASKLLLLLGKYFGFSILCGWVCILFFMDCQSYFKQLCTENRNGHYNPNRIFA